MRRPASAGHRGYLRHLSRRRRRGARPPAARLQPDGSLSRSSRRSTTGRRDPRVRRRRPATRRSSTSTTTRPRPPASRSSRSPGRRPAPRGLAVGRSSRALALAGHARLPRRATWQVSLWGRSLAALVLLLVARSAAERLVPDTGRGRPSSSVWHARAAVLDALLRARPAATFGFCAFCAPPAPPPLRRRTGCPRRPARRARDRRRVPARDRRRRLAAYAGRERLVPVRSGRAHSAFCPSPPSTPGRSGARSSSRTRTPYRSGTSGHDVIGATTRGSSASRSRPAGDRRAPRLGQGPPGPDADRRGRVGGLVVLLRGPARREATLALGVVAAFLVYNSSYFLPFAAGCPPAFLIPSLPFLALASQQRCDRAPDHRCAGGAVGARDDRRDARRAAHQPASVSACAGPMRDASFTNTLVTEAGAGRCSRSRQSCSSSPPRGSRAWSLPRTPLERSDLVLAASPWASGRGGACRTGSPRARSRGGPDHASRPSSRSSRSAPARARGRARRHPRAAASRCSQSSPARCVVPLKWVLLVVLASGAIVAVSLARAEATA